MVLLKKGVLYFLVFSGSLCVKENVAYSFCKFVKVGAGCVLLATEFQAEHIPSSVLLMKKIHMNWHNSSHGPVEHLIAWGATESHCISACERVTRNSFLPEKPSQFDDAMRNFVGIAETRKKKDLLHRIMAVHATRFLPQDGIIRVPRKTTTGGFRPKIHFNLGGLVQSHGGGNWEDAGLAIIVPMHSIANQLVNIYPDDTTILGDFEIPSGATIVANQEKFTRQDFANPTFRRMKILFFDPNRKTLRQKVSEVLESVRSVRILTRQGSILPAAQNLKYFQSFLKAYPHVTFGSERSTYYGQNGLFGQLDWNVSSLLSNPMYGFRRLKTNREMAFLLDLIEGDLRTLEEKVLATYSNTNALEGFEVAKRDLIFKLMTARKELQIRERGKSIFLSKKDELFYKVLDLRDQPEEQDRFIEQNFERFQDYDPEECGLDFDVELARSRLYWKLLNFEHESVLEIFRRFPFLLRANFDGSKERWVVVTDGEKNFNFLVREMFLSRKRNGSSFDWCITQAGFENLTANHPNVRRWKEGECFSEVGIEFKDKDPEQGIMEYGL